MTRDEMYEEFGSGDDDRPDYFLEFDGVTGDKRLANRPDLCAFLLLDRLVPGTQDIVACAEHDQIWLDVDLDALAAVITRDDVETLRRCGVSLDEETDSLFMYA